MFRWSLCPPATSSVRRLPSCVYWAVPRSCLAAISEDTVARSCRPVSGSSGRRVLVESTYGDRDHQQDDNGAQLAEVIQDTAARGGKLIVPAFAIGRVEELLYWVRRLEREKRIPVLPVYVDSPMATEALRHYTARVAELDPDMQPARKDVSTFATARFQTMRQRNSQGVNGEPAQRHRDLVERDGNRRARAASHGRCAAGRKKHGPVRRLSGGRHRGRALVDGAREVKIHGQIVSVGARIARNDSMSAHADRNEISGGWRRCLRHRGVCFWFTASRCPWTR